ncbi:hypothetical protein [Rhodanobacter sp. MP7CTX1]|uniref:hypothetical protein n=1 Tax=Rhodanobacter sp. MP7CTX1 TaxID=2723084 RepID=UPI001613C2E0|nr:hypothetical protein [Rhodanobacter sp. MP7CTX1]MBB6186195.1 CheY-like chemotaxis protein [Rhodanobacter sp. MP7CTX1]
MNTVILPAGSGDEPPHSALVVEDNKLVAETIADGLTAMGCESVECVTSVKAALKAVDEHDVDIAVVEAKVRGQSTEPVLDALNANDVAHVVASHEAPNPLPQHAPYLQKPFGLPALKDAVSRAQQLMSVRSWDQVL